MIIHTHPHTLHDPRVIDGDTLECWCECVPCLRLKIRIRLPGIEGGELGTPEGARAKLTLQNMVYTHWAAGARLASNTDRRDQYNRVLSDILLGPGISL